MVGVPFTRALPRFSSVRFFGLQANQYTSEGGKWEGRMAVRIDRMIKREVLDLELGRQVRGAAARAADR